MAQIHSGQSKRQITKQEFDNNWDRVFKKKKEVKEEALQKLDKDLKEKKDV